MTTKDSIMKVIKKELIEEPEPSEELYTVGEEVLGEDWTEGNRGQQTRSIEHPETCLVEEEVLEHDWTGDGGGQEILTEPMSTEQSDTCLVKEENLIQEDMTESSIVLKVSTEAKLLDNNETSIEEENFGHCCAELHEPKDNFAREICVQSDSQMGGVHKGPHTDCLRKESDAPKDSESTEEDMEGAVCRRLKEEVDWTEENDDAKEMPSFEDTGYQIYYIKQETMDDNCTEDDTYDNMQNSTQQMSGDRSHDDERHFVGYVSSYPEKGLQAELSGRERSMGVISCLDINNLSVKSTQQSPSIGMDHFGQFPLQAEIRNQSDSEGKESSMSEYHISNITNHAMNNQEHGVTEQKIPEAGRSDKKYGRINTDMEGECEEKMETITLLEDIKQSTQIATIENNVSKPRETNKHFNQRSVGKIRLSDEANHITHIGTNTNDDSNLCSFGGLKSSDEIDVSKVLKTNTVGYITDAHTYMYQYPTGKMEFLGEADLKQHIENHQADEKPYRRSISIICSQENSLQCSVCNKRFPQNSLLKRHMRMHAGEKSYQCQICFKMFTIKTNLTMHYTRMHTEEKPYKCSVCSKQFAQNFNLNVHMKIHTGEKPHQCGVCSKAFSRNSVLKRHMRIHTEKKSHQCPICSKVIKTNTVGNITNAQMYMYQCPTCNMEFLGEADLKQHIKNEKPYRHSIFNVCSQQKSL